jgi:DNA-binding IscR family transcriptional regulator
MPNTHFTLAIHILSLLAMQDRVVSSHEMAVSANTHPAFIRRIVMELVKAELVETEMGVTGGARLRYPAESITLKAVYLATCTGPVLSLHASEPNRDCPCGSVISPVLSDLFWQAEQALLAQLDKSTIREVVSQLQQRGSG